MIGGWLPLFLLPIGVRCGFGFCGFSGFSRFRFIGSAVVDCYNGFVERKIDVDNLLSVDSNDLPTGINELKTLSKEFERRPGINRSVMENREIVVDFLLGWGWNEEASFRVWRICESSVEINGERWKEGISKKKRRVFSLICMK